MQNRTNDDAWLYSFLSDRISNESWFHSILSKIMQESLLKIAEEIMSPEEKNQFDISFLVPKIVYNLIFKVFNDFLMMSGLMTIGAKLSIIQQIYLVMSVKNLENISKQKYLIKENIRKLLISSALVAIKADNDHTIMNSEMAIFWRNYVNITSLKELEMIHLKECDYAVMVSSDKLRPIFEEYADGKTLELIEDELLKFKDHEIHGVENDILLTIQSIIKQKEEILKSIEPLGTNLKNLSIFQQNEELQQQAVIITYTNKR